MKIPFTVGWIIGILVLLVAVAFADVHAASTDTVIPEQAALDALEQVAGFEPVARRIPVEQKVVEIHMTAKDVLPIEESRKRKSRKVETLPFRGGTCSGFFIDSTGDILTAKHCVEGFDAFEVQTYDRRKYAAVVIATSAAHDLALIHIDSRNTPYFLPADSVTRGEQIFVLGSPLGITDTLSTGIVARIDGDVTLIDCSTLPGNSGGPVFNEEGEIVGVLTAGYIVGFGVTHLNLAQGLDALLFFVRDALVKYYGR